MLCYPPMRNSLLILILINAIWASPPAYAESSRCDWPKCGDSASGGPKRIVQILKELPIKVDHSSVLLIRIHRLSDEKVLGSWGVEVPFMAATQSAIDAQCGRCSKLMPSERPSQSLTNFYSEVWSAIPETSQLICKEDLLLCLKKIVGG